MTKEPARAVAIEQTYSAMRIDLHDNARHFLAGAEPLLLLDPFSTNVVAVVASRIAAGHEPASSGHIWATIEGSEGQMVGVATHTPPHHLLVSRMPSEAAASLAHVLADAGRDLPGDNGAVGSTCAFAEAWTARTGAGLRGGHSHARLPATGIGLAAGFTWRGRCRHD